MPAAPKLPSDVQRDLRRIGEGIKTARLRRGMSQEELGKRAGVTFHTVRAMEQGRASTGIGHYLNALWVLGLLDTAGSLADPALDREGLTLEAAARRRRSGPRQVGRGQLNNDF
jgi:transcriptional regulator with XRE-family HTH domain